MYTQNGASDITSITKIKNFFRSMHLRVFLTVMLTGCVIAFVFCLITRISVENHSIKLRTEDAKAYITKLNNKMVSNVYTAFPQQSTDITDELDTAAALFEGRIIVTDSNLTIVYDSYKVEAGKTLISAEALGALKGNTYEYRDNSRQLIELSVPIVDNTVVSNTTQISSNPNSSIQGIMIISFSIDDCLKLSEQIGKIQMLIAVFAFILLCIIASVTSNILTKPFKKISQSIHHVSDGYIEEKVNIGGFTEMDQISDAFNDMLSRIATVEESRQEFVSNVSHELKTPLTSMKVLADSLIQQPDAPVEMYREFMMDINSEIERENKIITDLLALVKLDRKSGDMHIAEVSINELLDIIIKRVKPIAQASQVEVIFESYRDVIAEIDEVKLSLAITNLIENGIKYNRENGSVKVTLNSDHRFFMITVSDTGIGIPEGELDRIFDRFYRVDKMRSRATGGTGLGLAITRSIVLMHHGAVKVESVEGAGSTFMIKIPLSYIPEV